jgi:hypothetical protein
VIFSTQGREQFPSVRLQPLGHLSGANCQEASGGSYAPPRLFILWGEHPVRQISPALLILELKFCCP